MGKFNTKESNVALTYEYGKAYNKDIVEDYLNMLFSSFYEDTYYEDKKVQMNRFIELTKSVANELGWEFIAKSSMFARKEIGMRSTSQIVAAILNNEKFADKRAYFRNFCNRPDDMSEVFSLIDAFGDKRGHAIVRGFSDYLSLIGPYTLGKYKMVDKKYNMFDIINITHSTNRAINDYKKGCLDLPDTWEVNISCAKNVMERNQEWIRLVEQKILGYTALIRNLNNILNAANYFGLKEKWLQDILISQILDEKRIQKSKIFSYQIYCAYKNLKVKSFAIVSALESAFRIACGNMPKLDRNSVILLDVSGSMNSPISAKSKISIVEAGACYAAALYASQKCDFIKFGSKAKALNFNKFDNIFSIIEQMSDNDQCGYGTNISTAFSLLTKKYKRIFIVSDMQVMSPSTSFWFNVDDEGGTTYDEYCQKFGRTKCYSFDLGNYKTQVANPNNDDVHLFTSLDDNAFKFISILENNSSLIWYIRKYDYVKGR